MNLEDVKGSYDLYVSLGSWCGPSLNLRRHHLRRFSFPLDWSISNSLSDVNTLLKTNFYGYMELENLEKTEGFAHFLDDGDAVFAQTGDEHPVTAHFIKDNFSNIISVHDFPLISGQDWQVRYPLFKETLTNRIQRLYEKLYTSNSVLFLRWGYASADEMAELESILMSIIPNRFKIVILQPTEGINDIQDMNFPLAHVCSVQVPANRPNDLEIWDKVLTGFSLTNYHQ
ncbi:DUF1796 family putative cysteine peptidase [Bacillus sp. B1-b2]|uniref:DUF1796 family putative cysteine peptidase n=1 Tax=Bacillus sp. B1-b2 TaxID=2653201 RepID=UPI001261BA75|nr:peptidase [Bacillus sp. B1-b2]